MPERPGSVGDLGPTHLIGIGGAGMSALGKILRSRGVEVSGSDIKETVGIAALRALGARIAIGHDAGNLGEARSVVVSTAIRGTNPEVRAARARGIPVLHRAQVLALLLRERRAIVVAGTHGKTTTTSMLALILQHAGVDPTFVIGGDLNEQGTNAHDGAGDWIVAEADESDGSFLWLGAEIAVVTNIEAEHLDHYRDDAHVREAFLAFLQNVAPNGAIVAAAEDAGIASILDRIERRLITFGLARGDWTATREVAPDGSQRVTIRGQDGRTGVVGLTVPGEHNVRNALAAIAAATAAGVSVDDAAAALGSFRGVMRRFQERGSAGGVRIVDDYAHHPTEVRAAIATAREQAQRRVVAVFQPHLYSRTRSFADLLGAALADADLTVVTDVYGAREDPEPGVTGKLIVDGLLAARPRGRVAYLPRRGDIPAYLRERAAEGDLVLTIGAGDVTILGDEILRAIRERMG